MIRYALACDAAHDFESWFPSGEAYEAQVARGLVACPACGSTRVEKRIMAPAVARTDKARAPVPAVPTPAAPAEPQPVAVLGERERELRAMLRALREHVTRTADYVGDRFAEEARAIHYGDEEERSIYGEASAEEVRALLDEGVEIAPLPVLPDDRN
jgi:hypothetical protein